MKNIFILLFLALQGMSSSAQNCGPLDPVFGNGGKVLHTASTGSFDSRKVIVQPDNKIVHVFTIYTGSFYQFGVLRYKTEGQLDSSFGNNGSVTTAVGVLHSHASAGAIQPDGKIVVVGSAAISTNSFGFALVRYTVNGALDSSFGSGGKTVAKIGVYYEYPTALAIQPDGKIVVVGTTLDDYYSGTFAIARFNNNGSIDSSFGQKGKIVTHLGPFITNIGGQYYGRYADESAQAILIQPDGKIVVGGSSYTTQGCWDYYGGIYCNPASAMVRYNGNGIVDSSFGTNGKVADSLTLTWISSMALQNDGKILVCGNGSPNAFITKRYNSNGSIDNNFGNSGTSLTNISGSNTYHGARSIAIRTDGRIIVGGTLNINNISQFAVLRYTHNGFPDSSFNGNGTVFFKIGQSGSNDEINSVGLQGDKIIAGGNSRNNIDNKVVTIRLLDSGQLLTPFITADGPVSFCNGGTVKLSANETGIIQWYRNNLAINGATDTIYLATVTGSYTAAVTNLKGCGISSPIGVTVTIPFTPSITPGGSVALCTGDSIMLLSNSYGENQWYRDGVAITGSNNQALVVRTNGNYTIKVTVNGCVSAPSNEIKVTVSNTIPTAPAITAGGDTIFCNGSSVVLTSNQTTGNQWYKNGTTINGSTSASLNVTTSGAYTCRVADSGCKSSLSNTIVVLVQPTPPQPSIVWDGIKMSTNFGYAHYQWIFNGSAIAGNDSNSHKPTQTGQFKVIGTDAAGCSNTSAPFDLVVLGVADITIGDAKLRWYPNPANSVLNVDVNNVRSNKLHVELYDVTGRFIKKQKLNQNNNQLSVQGLTTGLYQLFIYNGREKTVVKLMVTK